MSWQSGQDTSTFDGSPRHGQSEASRRKGWIDTEHSRQRIGQRDITKAALALLIENGDREIEVGGGRIALTLSRRRLTLLPAAAAERLRNVLAVLHGDTLVTVLHATGPTGRRYRRRRQR